LRNGEHHSPFPKHSTCFGLNWPAMAGCTWTIHNALHTKVRGGSCINGGGCAHEGTAPDPFLLSQPLGLNSGARQARRVELRGSYPGFAYAATGFQTNRGQLHCSRLPVSSVTSNPSAMGTGD
jgi:hypothetical protein